MIPFSHGRRDTPRARVLLGTSIVVLISATLACDHEAPTGLRAVAVAPAHVVEIASSPQSAYDDGINRNDSYVEQTQTMAETTTVTSSTAFHDPTTGQLVYSATVGTVPQNVNVSAGYGYDGQPRVTTGFQETSAEETIWLRRVTDATTDVRGDGADTQPFRYDPMNEVGSLIGAQLDASGGGGGGGDCRQITGCLNLSADARVTMRSRSALRIEETRASAAQDKARHKVTRDLEMQDGEWVLKHLMSETFVDSPAGNTRFAFHLTVVASKRFRNRERDAERANGAHQVAQSTTAPMSVVRIATANDSCDPATAIIPCTTDPVSGSPTEPPHTDGTVVVGGDFYRWMGGTGPALLLQHGFMSDARTWNRMDFWLARDLAPSSILRFSTSWKRKYEEEAAELHGKMSSAIGSTPAILIGHSNGGMISRYLGRHPAAGGYAPAANIKAVITVGSPHVGAPLTTVGGEVTRLLGFGGFSPFFWCTWGITAGCDNFSRIMSSTLGNVFSAWRAPVPVLSEMLPRDSYHAQFNAEGETFRRFGVSSDLWTKWMLWRSYGDAYCHPEYPCGGAGQVRRADRIYKRDLACIVIGALFGRIDAAIRCASDATYLRGIDELFRRWVDFSGDGIVPLWSQQYPNVPAEDRYVVANGPSHLGETSSSRVGNRLENILVGKLGVSGKVNLAP
ncbi:MAG TPA: alpha/beta hydrolase [Gemmatimonadaceae bacterium]|nr:alpha/beta hydrolase [Gemmatimonadaceae bacterium]